MKYAFLSSLLVPIGIMVILLLMPLLLLVTNQANAQAQNQTQSPSQILQGYFNIEHVTIFYESPKTVILQGDLIAYDTLATVTDPSGKPATAGVITDTNIQRTDLWEAMDLLRIHGFEIQQVMTSGVGSESYSCVYSDDKMNRHTESLKEQIMYQREIGCHQLAHLLAEANEAE